MLLQVSHGTLLRRYRATCSLRSQRRLYSATVHYYLPLADPVRYLGLPCSVADISFD